MEITGIYIIQVTQNHVPEHAGYQNADSKRTVVRGVEAVVEFPHIMK